MGKNLDFINIVDLEASCWEDRHATSTKGEIIEFGITELNLKTLAKGKSESIYVKTKHSDISEYCVALTGISQDILDKQGIEYFKACQKLKEDYKSNNRIWASWGDYDRNKTQYQCEKFAVKYPFTSRHINIKTLFAIAFNLEKEVNVMEALNLLNMTFEGNLHSGKDDSYNIANIFIEIIKKMRRQIVE